MVDDFEDGKPVAELRTELDPQTFVDTEPPTGSDHATPTMPPYAGFPPAPSTGNVGFDTLLRAVTEIRDGVRASVDQIGRDVSQLARRVDGMATAVERRRVTDERDQGLLRQELRALNTAVGTMSAGFDALKGYVESEVGQIRERQDELESRVAALEAKHDNGSG